MAMDLYAKCPCGSGKKIKFCCRDIISDIDRIERMLRGEQRTAAIEKIDKLLSKHPDRPALLALKAQALFELKQIDDAKPVIDRLLGVEPDNPAALAMKAMLFAIDHDLQQALQHLHRAMRVSDGALSVVMVYKSCVSICVQLMQLGRFLAAYAHLVMLVSLTGGADHTVVSLLMNVTSSEKLPTIFQGLVIAETCRDHVTWKREFQVAVDLYRQGDWSEAAALLEDMNARILDEPVLLWNLAILQAWTLQHEKAVKTFRLYASIRGLELDDAVEAEACAQVLEPTADEDRQEAVRLTFDVDDDESLMERFLSDETVQWVPAERQAAHPDAPRPKGAFALYDRPRPPESDSVTAADLPRQYGSVSLYGRQTDRSARLVVSMLKDDDYETNLARLRAISGRPLSAVAETEVLGTIDKFERLFQSNFAIPPTTTVDRFHKLLREWYADQFENVWPAMRLSVFGGQSARQAARQPPYRRAVLAAILNLELWSDRHRNGYDFNRLRRTLDLPVREARDPAGVDVRTLSTSKLMQIDLGKLSDEDLARVFEITSVRQNGSFLYRVGSEVLNRPDMEGRIDFIEVHERLAELAITSDDQLKHLRQARDIAVGRGESPAQWLVGELDVRLTQGELDPAKRLIAEIQSRYLREPGIAPSLAAVLEKFGLMPGGTSGAAATGPATETARQPSAAAASAVRVWTPESGESTAPEDDQRKESKLWIPGMD